MILSKARRLVLLASLSCLLLMVFTGASYGVTIKWAVFGSPTEVINSGRSEVMGSVTLIVDDATVPPGGPGLVTGNPAGGDSQLNITFGPNANGPAIQIDNWSNEDGSVNSGIRVYGPQFASQSKPLRVQVINTTALGPCAGQITVFIPAGVTLHNGDMIRVDGVRLRVDQSAAVNVNTDIWVQVQSINDPTGHAFFPDTVRVAKSFPGMVVGTTSDSATLCLLNYGKAKDANGNDQFLTQSVTVTEGFFRAFVAKDANLDAAATALDRVDSGGPLSQGPPAFVGGSPTWLGIPLNGTQVKIYLSGIPASVTAVSWPGTVFNNQSTAPGPMQNFSWFGNVSGTTTFTPGTPGVPGNGIASTVYEYYTINQTAFSDFTLESFNFNPKLQLSAVNQQDTGIVLGGGTLWPPVESLTGCVLPYTPTQYASLGIGRPRFVTNYQSSNGTSGLPDSTTKQLPSNFGIYETFAQCKCFLLFPYVTTSAFYDTGIAVANTSMDTGVFPAAQSAPLQGGTITWFLYDTLLKALTPTGVNVPSALQPGFAVDGTGTPVYQAGQTFVALVSQILAQVTPAKASFSGYMIARANFQYCHGFAFLADKAFANIAQGYLAPVIPDPSVKLTYRTASAAADVVIKLLAGESLNN